MHYPYCALKILLAGMICLCAPHAFAQHLEWSSKTPPPERRFHTMTSFANKIWVIGGRHLIALPPNRGIQDDIWNSSDGSTWRRLREPAPFGSRSGHASIVFQNRLWVFGGIESREGNVVTVNDIWSSDDGLTWDSHTTQTAFTPRSSHTVVHYDDKLWIIGGSSQTAQNMRDVWSSPDGIVWSQQTAVAPFTYGSFINAFTADNKMWVIVLNVNVFEAWHSVNGIAWTRSIDIGAPSSARAHAVRFGNRVLLICTGTAFGQPTSVIYAKNDGETTWTEIAANVFGEVFDDCRSCIHNGKLWLLGSENVSNTLVQKLFSSSDGVTWTRVNRDKAPGDNVPVLMAALGEKLFAITMPPFVSNPPMDVWVSATGEDWSVVAPNPPFSRQANATRALLPANGHLYLVHSTGRVWSTSDGAAWTTQTTTAGFPSGFSLITSFVFLNELWVGGVDFLNGYAPHLWRSANGTSWQRVTTTGQFYMPISSAPSAAGLDGIRIYTNNHPIQGYFSSNGTQWSAFASMEPSPIVGSAVLRIGGDWFRFPSDLSPNGSGFAITPGNRTLSSKDGVSWTPSDGLYGFYPAAGNFVYFKNRIWMANSGPGHTIFSAPWPRAAAGNWLHYE